ncbi:unnamed protein product [Oncorhynchus mykiss]|uniref:Protein kinase domain-containing protein n=1 Tax=Oncorhynchus mykiss TaxID=8022 RepID=A0A060XL81_ONCMY|nr:unnamed protein product [Oncorhynchus mykiss]
MYTTERRRMSLHEVKRKDPVWVSAGSLWQDPLAIDLSTSNKHIISPRSRTRAVAVVYIVVEDASLPQTEENLSLKSVKEACADTHAVFKTIPFERISLGTTDILDIFYNAGKYNVAVVEISDTCCQQSLFYHLGVRESFSMTNNIILYCYKQDSDLQALKEQCGSYTFIPYVVLPQGKVFACDATLVNGIKELMQPSFQLEPLLTPLVERLIQLLDNVHVHASEYFRESIRHEIRTARERFSGQDLSQELGRIQKRLDTVELLSPDIIMNLLLSYRDVQDYDAIIKLVESLNNLPTCLVASQQNINFHYIFALNRRNRPGDRAKALEVILPIVESGDRVASDVHCLCGRIYKDMFMSSGFKDHRSRDQACYWYGKAFETEQTLHSGINNVVLLMAAGHEFDTSIELRKIGVTLSSLLGRKGSLEKMQDYWDVGFYLGASILANEHRKVIEASEKLYRLNAPMWYVGSIMETFILYHQFTKPPEVKPSKQETVDFWMELLLQACKPTVSTDRCPVLILEQTKVLQPTIVCVSEEDDSCTVRLSHITPLKKGQKAQWTFPASQIRGVSVSKFDERSCFLYVLENSDDFQLCFPSELHCKGFCEMVNSLLTQAEAPVEYSNELTGGLLEFIYETSENRDKVVLGKGTYGVVYAGRDLSNQVRIAIKEIPEKDSTYSQPLHEEMALHKRLKHRNIVQYLGSMSQDGFIKIFMEEVPGGTVHRNRIFFSLFLISTFVPIYYKCVVFRQVFLSFLHLVCTVFILTDGSFETQPKTPNSNQCRCRSTVARKNSPERQEPRKKLREEPRYEGWPVFFWLCRVEIITEHGQDVQMSGTGSQPGEQVRVPLPQVKQLKLEQQHDQVDWGQQGVIRPGSPKAWRGRETMWPRPTFPPDRAKQEGYNPTHVCQSTAPTPLEGYLQPPTYHPETRPSIAHKYLRHGTTQGGGGGATRTGDHISDSTHSSDAPLLGTAWKSTSKPVTQPLEGNRPGRDSKGGSLLQCLSVHLHTPGPKDLPPTVCLEILGTVRRPASCDRSVRVGMYLQDKIVKMGRSEPMSFFYLFDLYLTRQHWSNMITFLGSSQDSSNRMTVQPSRLLVRFNRKSLCFLGHRTSIFVLSEFKSRTFATIHFLMQQQVKPHWMFALDNLLRQAVQDAITVLLPELKLQLQSSFETKESSPERGQRPSELVKLLPAVFSDDQVAAPADTETIEETRRLLTQLSEKEREYQELLRNSVQRRQDQIDTTRNTSEPTDTELSLQISLNPEVKSLVCWLKAIPVDQDTIDKLLSHEFTLDCLLTMACRDDLMYCAIRGGMLCRVWAAITTQRKSQLKSQLSTHSEEDEDSIL